MAFKPTGSAKALPADMIYTDKNGVRWLRVDADLSNALLEIEATNSSMLEQLLLLNTRFEEAFDTRIKAGDHD